MTLNLLSSQAVHSESRGQPACGEGEATVPKSKHVQSGQISGNGRSDNPPLATHRTGLQPPFNWTCIGQSTTRLPCSPRSGTDRTQSKRQSLTHHETSIPTDCCCSKQKLHSIPFTQVLEHEAEMASPPMFKLLWCSHSCVFANGATVQGNAKP